MLCRRPLHWLPTRTPRARGYAAAAAPPPLLACCPAVGVTQAARPRCGAAVSSQQEAVGHGALFAGRPRLPRASTAAAPRHGVCACLVRGPAESIWAATGWASGRKKGSPRDPLFMALGSHVLCAPPPATGAHSLAADAPTSCSLARCRLDGVPCGALRADSRVQLHPRGPGGHSAGGVRGRHGRRRP